MERPRLGRTAPAELFSALLLAMRRPDEKRLVELFDAEGPAVGAPALEDGLDEAWRTACAAECIRANPLLHVPAAEDEDDPDGSSLYLFEEALAAAHRYHRTGVFRVRIFDPPPDPDDPLAGAAALELPSALLFAMRRGVQRHLVQLCDAAAPTVGWPTLEDGLDEAWRTACALNLPLREDMKECVRFHLAWFRFALSTEDLTSDTPPVADAQVRWDELWGRVDLLLKFSERLELELDPLRSCQLAKLCVQNLYRVKSAFKSTYSDVPWEDMEYLLVVFIATGASRSIAADVCLFRERVLEHVKKNRDDSDSESVAAMRRLQKNPKGKERATATLPSVNDLPVPRQHSAVLRDWHCRDPPPAADAHVRWHELWDRVDLLLEYSRRLQDELEQLQSREWAPGSADKSVMLARMCALAVHNVKGSFLSTYTDVPWEEMEYLLVMFIEARTLYATLAHVVATAFSTAAHLRCFRKRLEKYVLVHRAEPDPEAAMKRLEDKPEKERAILLGAVVDSALTDLRKDFALLRDWQSLEKMNKSLSVTCEALLSPEDDAWVAWRWLSVQWGMFVVGERAKYSWTSPNLSPRWADLVEDIAPSGILKLTSRIRNDQKPRKDSSNAKTLALWELEERKELAEELEKLKNAVCVALEKIGKELGDESDLVERIRLIKNTNLIVDEVMKILEQKRDTSKDKFKKIESCAQELKKKRDWFENERFVYLSMDFALAYFPEAADRVGRLLLDKSTANTESFQAELKEDSLRTVVSPLKTVGEALTALAAVPDGQLSKFAVLGALRQLASRWHEHDQVVPTDVPFSPALFGRQLRNYLNHLDEVFRSPLELTALYHLLSNEVIPLERGARPRLRDLQWSRAENERLLRLVEVKSDMFRCARERAREGDLDELVRLERLKRLVEDGADVSARDCQDRTLLHAAAQGGQAHVVRWLLELGAEAVDPLAEDWRGRTALHVAGTAAVAEALLATGSVHHKAHKGTFTPLHHAAECGRTEVVAVLLRDPRDLDAGHKGLTPLHYAARYGHDEVVRLLLDAGARYQADAEGLTPLVAAAISGSAPTVRLLLGAARPPADEDCWNAAEEAAARDWEEACFSLLDELEARGVIPEAREVLPEAREVLPEAREVLPKARKVLPEAREVLPEAREVLPEARKVLPEAREVLPEAREVLPEAREVLPEAREVLPEARVRGARGVLLKACWVGSISAITLRLLDRWPGALSERLDTGTTVLHVAAYKGRAELVRALLRRGADPLGETAEGGTALDCAARGGSSDTIDALVERIPGGSLQAALTRALSAAALFGQLEAAQRLVHHGAEVNAVNRVDQTPLYRASAAGHAEVVQWLLQRGADPRLGERPPLHQAAFCGRLSVVELLVPQGRKEDERLRLLQQVDREGFTALHLAALVSALPVVKYLLQREEELLRPIYRKHKTTGVPRLDGLTVYARDAEGRTALQCGAGMLGACAPSVAEALLEKMGDEVWMALGHKDLQEVRGMVVEALELAAARPGGLRLAGALHGWLSHRDGLEDIQGEGGVTSKNHCTTPKKSGKKSKKSK